MKMPAAGLDFASGEKACAGDSDEGVAGGDAAGGPAVEAGSGVGVHLRGEARRVQPRAVEEIVGGVKEREGADEGVGETFTFETCPGPGGVDLLEMIAAVKLVREFEVVEDSKDGLGDFHRRGYALESC